MMKKIVTKFLWVSLFLIANVAAAGTERILSNDALKGFNEEYLPAKTNKAFAQSSSGAWGWVSDLTSRKHAILGAIAQCKQYLEKGEPACKVINVNGKWAK
ncbi:MAG TPA: hypothetical protein PL131_05305 [Methylotenera sp.]|nr:hypothetical protein [Methylotenera sp.]HPH05271.1 hypothetical protein [Methylotenera sp.]HPN00173.1 hypothetical protein [Methylotenera sp.]